MFFFKKKIFTRKFFFFGFARNFFLKKKSLKLSRMGGFRRVQMGGLVAWVGCMGGLRDGVGMGGFINISVNV